MCGIIGYVGPRPLIPVLIGGLQGLEYRGYDSAGIAYFFEGRLSVVRSVGKIASLEERLFGKHATGSVGIGHTRWATHGRPSENNAHPHCAGPFALVHNGIIENAVPLKQELAGKGYTFSSETDTEVLVKLIFDRYQASFDLREAFFEVMRKVRGSYAFCLLSEESPDLLVAVRSGCPLVIGVGEKEYFVASDTLPFLSYTRKVAYLHDGEVAFLKEGGLLIQNVEKTVVTRPHETLSSNPMVAEKGSYRHFMEKEIYDQPQAVLDTFQGRILAGGTAVSLDGVPLPKGVRRVIFVACGTSWHAARIGRFFMEGMARLPVMVERASEFRTHPPPLFPGDLVVTLSQSGETADTLAGLREAKKQGVPTLAICNVVGSTLAREADTVLYTHAGPEISVASTKTFTAQIVALLLFAISLGEKRGTFAKRERKELLSHLMHLPQVIEAVLKQAEEIDAMAELAFRYSNCLYLGRGIHYPVALEGALKLKEIAYIHAEGLEGGEMKHGPIALIDEAMPVVFVAPRDSVYEKTFSNIMEVKARGGRIFLFTDTPEPSAIAEAQFVFPQVPFYLSPVVATIPLQLLAYYIAVRRGSDLDQPRNLAKSVTVE